MDQAIPRLAAAGVDSPRLDAELLLAHVLGKNRTYLFAHVHDPVSPEARAELETLLRRREAREPLPYLLGTWEFMGLPFRVSPAVLIPRPETEGLVEAVAERLLPHAPVRILDVGTGSGCIAVGLAKLLPRAELLALEPSAAAAALARENIAALGVAERVRVQERSFPLDADGRMELGGPLDAVVSNPPYIPSREVDELAPELRLHEPRAALDGGPDGLSLIRPLIAESPALLKPGGLLALEVAMGQAALAVALLRAHPAWAEPEVVPDLAGIPRVVLARRL